MKHHLHSAFFLLVLASLTCTSSIMAQEAETPAHQAETLANPQALYDHAMEAYEIGEFQHAGELLVQAMEFRSHPVDAYNAACSFALAGNTDEALKYAERSLELGWVNFEGDKDFDSIREEPRFKAVLKKAAAQKKALEALPKDPLISMPNGSTKPAGMLVLIHGYGGSPSGFTAFHQQIADENNLMLVACRGTEASSEEAFNWNYSDEEIARILNDIEVVSEKFKMGPSNTFLSGFSQGGYLTLKIGLEHSELFRGIMPVAGMYSQERIDLEKVKNKNIKIFSILGEQDRPDYMTNGAKLQEDCKEKGLKLKYNVYDIGHTHPANFNEIFAEALKWFAEK